MPAKKYATKEEAAAAKNARKRERYATDPAYREKVNKRNRAAHAMVPAEVKRDRARRWAEANREKSNSIKRAWADRNPEKVAASRAAKSGTEEQRLYKRTWQANALKSNVQYRVMQTCRDRMNKALCRKTKTSSTIELLGCSADEFRAHLESQWKPGMSWQNHTIDGWHVDHIRPLSSFDLTDPEQQKAAFHYTNCQPLWAAENFAKNAKWEAA
jgi:hypothetical protein